VLAKTAYRPDWVAATEAARGLSDQELQELLSAAASADSAELKLTVPETHHRSTVAALGLDPLAAQIRQVFFLDTPDLALDSSGLVVRARRVQGRDADSVVKLRPVVPEDLPRKLRKSPDLVVEVDAMPGGYVCSAALKRQFAKVDVREAVRGDVPLRKLFSKEQRRFYNEHAPAGVELDDLTVLGPIFVLKLNFVPEGLDRKLVAEMWLYPDGSRILELSTKCAPSEMFDVAAQSRAFLASCGVDLSGKQQTKTRTALRFFAKEAATSSKPAPASASA
jgi:hypothetical protein